MRWAIVLACLLLAAPASAQESKLHAEFRREGERLKENCSEFRRIFSCVTTLVTDHPVHLAVGSLAPQNGFGFGPAFTTNWSPSENWRYGVSADIVGATSGAWRGGAYMKLVHTPIEAPVVVTNPGAGQPRPTVTIREYSVFHLYAQTTSLPNVSFFGLGPDSFREAQTSFGLKQTIIGGDAIVPLPSIAENLRVALLGEVNGRFVDVGPGDSSDVRSIEEVFSEATAPGLTTQPRYFQLGEGIRIKPSLLDGRVRLNYMAKLQHFLETSDSPFTFHRLTLDLNHEIPIYRDSNLSTSRDSNGPNECAIDPATDKCPSISRNLWGAVNLRMLLSKSYTSGDNVVPFFFQQTLGGSDINGNRVLPSYDDYRFRGPHVFALQQSFEHSIFTLPVGIFLGAEQGKIGVQGGGRDFGDFIHSYTVGLTLRAGGIPVGFLTWSTGGSEGSHFAITMSTTLLGGSSRPPLQ